jgi:hypothetical protein
MFADPVRWSVMMQTIAGKDPHGYWRWFSLVGGLFRKIIIISLKL